MSDNLFSPNKEFSDNAYINSIGQYQDLYKKSILDPDTFWAEIADRITWFKKWDQVRSYNYNIKIVHPNRIISNIVVP